MRAALQQALVAIEMPAPLNDKEWKTYLTRKVAAAKALRTVISELDAPERRTALEQPDPVAAKGASMTKLRAAAQRALKAMDMYTDCEEVGNDLRKEHGETYSVEEASLYMGMLWAQAQRLAKLLREALAQTDTDAPERRCGGPGCDMTCCQPVEEPVAWIEGPHGEIRRNLMWKLDPPPPQSIAWSIPLYTRPPRRTGLPHCERSCEANAFQIEIRRLKAELKQARPPRRELTDLTDEEMTAVIDRNITITDQRLRDAVYGVVLDTVNALKERNA